MAYTEADILLISRGYLIADTTGEAATFGLLFALYVLCARSLYLQLEDQDQRKQYLFTLVYMSLLMTLALFDLVADSHEILTSYVDHADYPGGAYRYASEVFQKSPVDIMGYTAAVLLDSMTFGIQIWRLWIVWRASPYSLLITALPALALLVEIGMEIANVVIITQSRLTPHLAVLFFYGEVAFLLCIPVTVTFPIIARIAMVRRKSIKITGQTDNSILYTSVISMLVESFALESVWMLVTLGTSFPTSPITLAASFFFSDTRPFIQVLSYLLVVHRVKTGRAWKGDTETKLTTLQWNRDGLQTTQIGTRTSTHYDNA